MRGEKFHGRVANEGRECEKPGCGEEGEFRAPGRVRPGFDGPGEWRWFCLDHVREFNAGYDWFAGMSAEEIYAAQSPAAGWASETRAFRADGGVAGMPRWADFADPLDAIGARAQDMRKRARNRQETAQAESQRMSPLERAALETMGLTSSDDRKQLRRRYSELVRRYHPDRNGGDRSHEGRLQRVVEAYQLLRRAESFG